MINDIAKQCRSYRRFDQEVRIVGKREDGSLKYYRDESQVHYVPKRDLDEILVVAR